MSEIGGGGGGKKRSFALSAIMLVTFGLIAILGIAFVILVLVTLFSAGVWITWLYIPLWTPAIIGFGAYIVATLDTRQAAPIYAQSSILSALLGAVGTIFMIIAGYLYTSLWARCVFPWLGTLDTLENIMCNDEYWVVWVAWIWTIVFLFVSLGVALSAGYDAFTRVSRMNLFQMAQGGIEQTVDVFGQPFQKAFSKARRRGKPKDEDLGLGLGLEEDDEEEEEEQENLYGRRHGRRGRGRGKHAPLPSMLSVAEKRRRLAARNAFRSQRH